MKIAVITPYYQESLAQLQQCHQSVLAQQGDVTHIMVADGHPQAIIDTWDCQHMVLPNHNDYGDTPRGIGAASAAAQGFDGICFLDADNWYEPQHIANIVACFAHYQCGVITTARRLYTMSGQLLGLCPECDGQSFVDTNCYFFHKSAFHFCRLWLFKPKAHSMYGDRVVWQSIVDSDFPRAHINIPTVNYVTDFAVHFHHFGLTPPNDSRTFSTHLQRYISYQEQLARLQAGEPA